MKTQLARRLNFLKNKFFFHIFTFLFLLVVLPLVVLSLSQRQEIRKRAVAPSVSIVDDFDTLDTNRWNIDLQNDYRCVTGPDIGRTGSDLTLGARGVAEAVDGKLRLYREVNCGHRFVYVSSNYSLNTPFFEAEVTAALENQQGWGVGWGIENIFWIWYPNNYTDANLAWIKPDGSQGALVLRAGDTNLHTFKIVHKQIETDLTKSKFQVLLDGVVKIEETYLVTNQLLARNAGKIYFGNPVTGQCEGWRSCRWQNGTLDETGAGPWPRLVIDGIKIYGYPFVQPPTPTTTPMPMLTTTPTPTPTPAPTCDVRFINNSVTLPAGGTSKLFVLINFQNGTISQVRFSSNSPLVASVQPVGGDESPTENNSPESYSSAVSANDVGETQVEAKVYLNPLGILGCTAAGTVKVVASPGWFQTKGGNVHSQADISSQLPQATVFSAEGEGGSPGVVSHGSTFHLGDGGVSSRGWLVRTPIVLRNKSYDYFYQLLGAPTVSNFNGPGSVSYDGVFYRLGDYTLNNDWTVSGGIKAVVLINGNLIINKKIMVKGGSFLGFVVKGDIKINGQVGESIGQAGANDPDIEGLFVADGMLDTNYNTDTSAKRLVAGGIFSASRFIFGRDLKSGNLTVPGELFVYRPDLLVNSFQGLWSAANFWEELAP